MYLNYILFKYIYSSMNLEVNFFLYSVTIGVAIWSKNRKDNNETKLRTILFTNQSVFYGGYVCVHLNQNTEQQGNMWQTRIYQNL